jgi:ubiquitin-protein ligase
MSDAPSEDSGGAAAAAATPALLRLMSDLKAITREPPPGASARPVADDNLFVWLATIFGPSETPWEGGIFQLKLVFPPDYPSKPPRVRFISELFHPNVWTDGGICLDILQDKVSTTWGRAVHLSHSLLFLADIESSGLRCIRSRRC